MLVERAHRLRAVSPIMRIQLGLALLLLLPDRSAAECDTSGLAQCNSLMASWLSAREKASSFDENDVLHIRDAYTYCVGKHDCCNEGDVEEKLGQLIFNAQTEWGFENFEGRTCSSVRNTECLTSGYEAACEKSMKFIIQAPETLTCSHIEAYSACSTLIGCCKELGAMEIAWYNNKMTEPCASRPICEGGYAHSETCDEQNYRNCIFTSWFMNEYSSYGLESSDEELYKTQKAAVLGSAMEAFAYCAGSSGCCEGTTRQILPSGSETIENLYSQIRSLYPEETSSSQLPSKAICHMFPFESCLPEAEGQCVKEADFLLEHHALFKSWASNMTLMYQSEDQQHPAGGTHPMLEFGVPSECAGTSALDSCARMSGCCAGEEIPTKVGESYALLSSESECTAPTCAAYKSSSDDDTSAGEDAATAATVVVASTVVFAVGNSVVTGSASSAGSGAAGGAAGGGALILINQVQFLAIAGRIGGSQSLPVGSTALSDGLAWLNFHLFSFDSDCPRMSQDKSELGATMLMCSVALIVTSVSRELLARIMPGLLHKFGREVPKSGLFPFPSWELQVLSAEMTGICTSIGYAIGSTCSGYQFGGTIILLVFECVLAGIWMMILYGFVHRTAVHYKEHPPSFLSVWKDARTEIDRTSMFSKLKGEFSAMTKARSRGEWASNQEEEATHFKADPWSNFLLRYSSFFGSYTEEARWFGPWTILKTTMIGVILGTVSDPVTNSTFIWLIYVADLILAAIKRPWIDRIEMVTNLYTGLMRVLQLTVILSYFDGTTSAKVLDDAFLALSLLGLFPLFVQSLAGEGVSLLLNVMGLMNGSQPTEFTKVVSGDVSFPKGDSAAVNDGFELAANTMGYGDLAGTSKGAMSAESRDLEQARPSVRDEGNGGRTLNAVADAPQATPGPRTIVNVSDSRSSNVRPFSASNPSIQAPAEAPFKAIHSNPTTTAERTQPGSQNPLGETKLGKDDAAVEVLSKAPNVLPVSPMISPPPAQAAVVPVEVRASQAPNAAFPVDLPPTSGEKFAFQAKSQESLRNLEVAAHSRNPDPIAAGQGSRISSSASPTSGSRPMDLQGQAVGGSEAEGQGLAPIIRSTSKAQATLEAVSQPADESEHKKKDDTKLVQIPLDATQAQPLPHSLVSGYKELSYFQAQREEMMAQGGRAEERYKVQAVRLPLNSTAMYETASTSTPRLPVDVGLAASKGRDIVQSDDLLGSRT